MDEQSISSISGGELSLVGTWLEDLIICFNATRINEMSIIFGL